MCLKRKLYTKGGGEGLLLYFKYLLPIKSSLKNTSLDLETPLAIIFSSPRC